MKRIRVGLIAVSTLLTIAVTPVMASPAADLETLCNGIGEIAYAAGFSRDAGESREDAVHEFNHAANKEHWKNQNARHDWIRYNDILIHQIYENTHLTPYAARDHYYADCKRQWADVFKSDSDPNDADLATGHDTPPPDDSL
jgi:hypothetical protein